MLHPNTSVTIPFAPAVASLYWWTSYFVSWFSVVDRKWCPTATSVDIGMIKGCHKRKQQIWQYWSNIGKQILLEQSQPYENQPLHTTATSLNVKQRLILMAALAGHSCHWPLAEKLDSHPPTLLDSRTWRGEFIWTLKIHLPFGTLPCQKGVDSILHQSLNVVPFVSNLLEGMHVNVIKCLCKTFNYIDLHRFI